MGSNAVQTEQIALDLCAAIQTAFPGLPVEIQDPKLPIGGYSGNVPAPNGFVIISAPGVPIEFGGVVGSGSMVQQANHWAIRIRKPWPKNPAIKILLAQVGDANALIAQLQTGSNFGSTTPQYGIMPLVTSVDYSDQGSPEEQIYTTTLEFLVYTRAAHH